MEVPVFICIQSGGVRCNHNWSLETRGDFNARWEWTHGVSYYLVISSVWLTSLSWMDNRVNILIFHITHCLEYPRSEGQAVEKLFCLRITALEKTRILMGKVLANFWVFLSFQMSIIMSLSSTSVVLSSSIGLTWLTSALHHAAASLIGKWPKVLCSSRDLLNTCVLPWWCA